MTHDPAAAAPDGQPVAQQPATVRPRAPVRRKLPSPWAAIGPEGSWWHGGSAGPPTGGDDATDERAPHATDEPVPHATDERAPHATDEPAPTPPPAARPPTPQRPAQPPPAQPPLPARAPLTQPPLPARPRAARPTRRARRRQVKVRRPVTGLAWILVLSAAAAFFGWVSAEPLWLAAGRGTAGTATVIGCSGSGLSQRCLGDFVANSGFAVERVRLLGVPPQAQQHGTQLAAQMLGRERGTAYVAADLALLHLRWTVGWTLVGVCAVALVWGSGARRLATRQARCGATAAALAAPILVAAGFLVATW
ncbi:hypothetical protein ACN27F_13630 [Solwaraspora sp. WMMB335]|uniref:hypothetical protein n=1 Tax=Solwaraspora sp. WMMB335 TaxID=3404118 RepID=UPI003B93C84C